jgi:uncharacterized membrane protein YadS
LKSPAKVDEKKKNAFNLMEFVPGFLVVVALAFLARWIKIQVYGTSIPVGIYKIPGKALEYPLWAVLTGILLNVFLKKTGLYGKIKAGFRTELFLKIGLVLLGITVSFKIIITAAAGAVPQAVIMIGSVYFFCWWLSGKFKLPATLRAVMSSAIAICGVSAAIAAAAAVQAKKQEITYITTLVILVALPMMVLMPIFAGWMGLPQAVAGAWFGGNVDTTAAVMGAGKIYSAGVEGKVTAETIASIVKNTQNAFIGVVAFLLALKFASISKQKKNRPSAGIIWDRFPKFVLGFLLISILYSAGWIPEPLKKAPFSSGDAIVAMKDWAFCLAFVSMGLNMSLTDLREMGWSPVIVFLIVTLFNTVLALGISWAIFGWLFPA